MCFTRNWDEVRVLLYTNEDKDSIRTKRKHKSPNIYLEMKQRHKQQFINLPIMFLIVLVHMGSLCFVCSTSLRFMVTWLLVGDPQLVIQLSISYMYVGFPNLQIWTIKYLLLWYTKPFQKFHLTFFINVSTNKTQSFLWFSAPCAPDHALRQQDLQWN